MGGHGVWYRATSQCNDTQHPFYLLLHLQSTIERNPQSITRSITPIMQTSERVSTPTWICELCSSGAQAYLSPQLPPFDVESRLSSNTSSSNNSLTAVPRSERSKTPKPEPAPSLSTSQLVMFISITCVSQLLSLSAMNQTVAPVMILARYFGVQNYGELSWFSAAYSMSVGTFILPAGKLSPFLLCVYQRAR